MGETPMEGLAEWLRADALDANPRNAAKLNHWASEVEAARASLPAPKQPDSFHQAQPFGEAATAQPNVRDWIADLLRRWNEAYPRMDINSPPGTVVMFDGRGGYEGEQEDARAALLMRGLYEVQSISIGSCSSTVSLIGVKGRFNTVLFSQAPSVPGSQAGTARPRPDEKETPYGTATRMDVEIRLAALEEAAKACEATGREYWEHPEMAATCAAAIRALKKGE